MKEELVAYLNHSAETNRLQAAYERERTKAAYASWEAALRRNDTLWNACIDVGVSPDVINAAYRERFGFAERETGLS